MTSLTTVDSAARADVATINTLAAKQKALIDLMRIPFLLLTAHRSAIQAEDQVDRPLRANVNVGSWPRPAPGHRHLLRELGQSVHFIGSTAESAARAW